MKKLFNRIYRVDPSFIEIDLLLKYAVSVLSNGGLVIFPTSTIYGIAGDALKTDTVKKIFLIKKRSPNKPISIIIPKFSHINYLAKNNSFQAMFLMHKFWPGNVTFVVHSRKIIPSKLVSNQGKVGLRIPNNRVAMLLVKAYGSPLTATSANISGHPSPSCIDDIDQSVINAVDLIIDFGFLAGGVGSTIVDITVNPVKILREGSIKASEFAY